ncbi:hypothetical protein WMY93_033344 [Mugilogobius chulae]|uniref:Uncharacterized protein n=1 Tax=Mugilogobius chulae TaxID=88201 RepID=A0AAW0MU55_9GOBI
MQILCLVLEDSLAHHRVRSRLGSKSGNALRDRLTAGSYKSALSMVIIQAKRHRNCGAVVTPTRLSSRGTQSLSALCADVSTLNIYNSWETVSSPPFENRTSARFTKPGTWAKTILDVARVYKRSDATFVQSNPPESFNKTDCR